MVSDLYGRLSVALSRFHWLPPLFSRICVGFVFVNSGIKKLSNVERTIDYFEKLGIPHAHFQAPFVGTVETITGIALILGLATRVITVPMIIIMIVAMLTARANDIHDLLGVLNGTNFLYILVFLWLIMYGPGPISIDHLLKQKQTKLAKR